MESKIIKENFSIDFEGTIWKQFFRPQSTDIIIEERFENELHTQFHCINIVQGELLETIIPEETWWETISSVASDEILTTRFGEKNAEVKESRKYPLLSAEKTDQLEVLHPTIYREETNEEYFKEVASFVQESIKSTPLFAVEYLEYNDLIVISYYIHGAKKLENRIVIFDADSGDLIYQECLGANLSGIAFDTFIVVEGQLIFVKELKRLISLKLNL